MVKYGLIIATSYSVHYILWSDTKVIKYKNIL